MTRDFHLIFNSVKDAQRAQDILKMIKIKNDKVVTDAFGHFDLNDKELFLSFIYSSENQDVQMTLNNTTVDLKNEIVFVAIKNGGHDARGWAYIPNNIPVNNIQNPIKIWNLGKFFYNYVSSSKS
ncbi:hypothetical protein N9C24_03635 [Gammaproteobacteria bacterium]|nr:hypothetical protein [Gammaproteobacteria bacterium]